MLKKIIKKLILVTALLFTVSTLSITGFANSDNGMATPSGIPYSKLKDTIDKYSQEYIGKTTAGASVAIMKNSSIVFKGEYGFADISNRKKVWDDTIFEWGSNTKLLVWVSVMQLVEQGRIDLDTDILTYLPEGFLKKLKYKDKITMLNLMNHNAGWEEHLTDIFYSDPEAVKPLEEVLKAFEPYQVRKPGETVAYSNYGAGLAAYIVEKVSGMKFYDYVRKYIFEPLEMKNTSINPLQSDNKEIKLRRFLTKGYSFGKKGFIERKPYFIGLYPAGGAVGTLSDVCRFVGALIPADGKTSALFKRNDTLSKMYSKSYEPAHDFPGICHGFWEHYYSVRVMEHGGNTDSFSSQIAFAPKEGFAVIVMTNQAHENSLCYGLKDKLFGSYKVKFKEKLPAPDILFGDYRSLRRPYSGFTQWLNLIVSEVRKANESSLNIDGDIYRQIRPNIFYNYDVSGASNFIYFNTENGHVKSMYMEYGEYEPISKITTYKLLSSYILIVLCTISFIIILIVCGIRKIMKKKINSSTLLISLFGIISAVNTGILFFKSFNYPQYSELKINFYINLFSAAGILILLIVKLLRVLKKKDKWKQLIFSAGIPLIYLILVFVFQLYK